MKVTVSELIRTEGWCCFSMTLPHVSPEQPVVTMFMSPKSIRQACTLFGLEISSNVIALSINLPRVDENEIKKWIDLCVKEKQMYVKWCSCPSQCTAELLVEVDEGLENDF